MVSGGGAGPIAFAVGPGDGTTYLTPPVMDLSWRKQVTLRIVLTTAEAAADDHLRVQLESTIDGTFWNARARSIDIEGDFDVSASAPRIWRLNVQNQIPLESTEEAYEETGSDDAPALADGSVRNGPFPGKVFVDGAWIANWRIALIVDDDDNDASFAGTVQLLTQ